MSLNKNEIFKLLQTLQIEGKSIFESDSTNEFWIGLKSNKEAHILKSLYDALKHKSDITPIINQLNLDSIHQERVMLKLTSMVKNIQKEVNAYSTISKVGFWKNVWSKLKNLFFFFLPFLRSETPPPAYSVLPPAYEENGNELPPNINIDINLSEPPPCYTEQNSAPLSTNDQIKNQYHMHPNQLFHKDSQGRSALIKYIQEDNLELVKWILAFHPKVITFEKPLIEAAKGNKPHSTDMLKLLLSTLLNIDPREKNLFIFLKINKKLLSIIGKNLINLFLLLIQNSMSYGQKSMPLFIPMIVHSLKRLPLKNLQTLLFEKNKILIDVHLVHKNFLLHKGTLVKFA